MKTILLTAGIIASINAYAVLGPIPIYLNTEYRTDSPVIGSIASTLSFDEADIKNSGANTFAEFLTTIPSINATTPPGNIPSVFIRGNTAKFAVLPDKGRETARDFTR